tara:strand:- start:108 stop:326 length:219 start_codon:yes stop_codon:yes gene_type:complete
MATNEDVREHLEGLRDSVNAAVNTVVAWQTYGTKLTAGNQATELAKVTTVPTARQHASDCAICTAWDGSVRA